MRFPLAALAVILAVTMPAALAGQEAVLEVRVVDGETGRPLVGAQVSLVGARIEGVADEQGRVRIAGVQSGQRRVEASLLGYETGGTTIMVAGAGITRLDLELKPSPVTLEAVEVEGVDSPLAHNGFLERMEAGHGTFFTREDIEEARPRYLSDMLRRVSGLSVRPTRGGATRAISRGNRPNCNIQYYLNGVLAPSFDIDQILPGDVEGMEIYRGSATIPPAFNRGTALCGVIVIWTRAG